MRTAPFRSRALGAGLLLLVALAVGCSSGGDRSPPERPPSVTPEATATPASPTATPFAEPPPVQGLSRAKALGTLGLREVIAVAKVGDAAALIGLFERSES